MKIVVSAHLLRSSYFIKLKSNQHGFALIASISILSLLMMLALALLSLSATEQRSSQNDRAQQEAKANARMALMVALGELQVSLGPDQRISVSSSILDMTPDTEEVDGLAHQNLLMVYDSWNTHLHGKKFLRDENGEPTSSSIAITDTYEGNGRHPNLFRKFLVSHQDSGALKKIEAARTKSVLGMNETNSVVLVRPVSIYDSSYRDEADLRAGLIPISKEEGGSGSYAWAVVGRNLPSAHTYEERSTLGGVAGESDAAGNPRRYDISTFDQSTKLAENQTLYQKMISQNEIDLVTSNGTARRNYFHLTGGQSYSLLTDARNSGLKKDLNLFLESDWGDFQSGSEYGEYKAVSLQGATVEMPLCGIDAATAFSPSNPNVPPTSWRQLRDYYRLYRNDLNYESASVQWEETSPVMDYLVTGEFMDPGWGAHHNQYRLPDTLGYHRSPVIARLIYLVGLSSEEHPQDDKQVNLSMHVSPVLVLWNPYSVALRVKEVSPPPGAVAPYSDFTLQSDFNRAFMVEYLLRVSGINGPRLNSWRTPPAGQGMDNAGNYWDDVVLTNGKTEGQNDVQFQPGEVRIFSMQKLVGQKVHFTPGFNNNVFFDDRLRRTLATIPKNKLSSTAFSLKFQDSAATGLWGSPEIPRAYGAHASAFGFESYGRIVATDGAAKTSLSVKAPRGPRGGVVMDWFTSKGASIIKDSPGEAVKFPSPSAKPQPVAIFGMSLKGVEEYDEPDSSLPSSKPVANRTWLHANPTQVWRHLFNPTHLKRTAFPYEIIYGTAVGNSVAEHLQSDGQNAFMGPSNGAAGVTHFAYQEIPLSPVTSLAGLSGMRLTHGRPVEPSYVSSPGLSFGPNTQHVAHWGAAFGCGVGNSFAHPLISGNQVYQKHDGGTNLQSQPVFEDHYDTLFLANDALYDEWVCSSISPQMSPAYEASKTTDQVISGLVTGSSDLPNQRLKLHSADLSKAELMAKFKQDSSYKLIAEHLLVSGGFNVNNPHVESWKALLHGLKNRQVPYIDAVTSQRGLSETSQGLALSRFRVATGGTEGSDESDPAAWTGIRYLNDAEIDKLAEEIVRQVKYRGPFLNMSEFVNRRLSSDKFGVCGTLQAAIDYDDFDNNFNGSGGKGFNGHLKSDIVAPDVKYAFSLAAKGSHYTGIPGYLMQADLLKAMENVLTVRDDTFVIRAYGDSRSADGEILARAWCEATVQRMPYYLDSDLAANSTSVPAYKPKFGSQPSKTALSDKNRKFGRKFKITAFRWVSEQELN